MLTDSQLAKHLRELAEGKGLSTRLPAEELQRLAADRLLADATKDERVVGEEDQCCD